MSDSANRASEDVVIKTAAPLVDFSTEGVSTTASPRLIPMQALVDLTALEGADSAKASETTSAPGLDGARSSEPERHVRLVPFSVSVPTTKDEDVSETSVFGTGDQESEALEAFEAVKPIVSVVAVPEPEAVLESDSEQDFVQTSVFDEEELSPDVIEEHLALLTPISNPEVKTAPKVANIVEAAGAADVSSACHVLDLDMSKLYNKGQDSPTLVFEEEAVEQKVSIKRLSTGESYRVECPAIVGKGTKATVIVSGNEAISRLHARFQCEDGSYYVSDNGSSNGTYVNEQRIAQDECMKLESGDIVRLADESFQFIVD